MKKTLYLNGIAIGELESTGDLDEDADAAQKFLKERGLWKATPQDLRIFNQAVAFSSTAGQLYTSLARPPHPDWKNGAPFVVNAALACELYLKALAAKHGKSLRGHELVALYGALPAAARAQVEAVQAQSAAEWKLPSTTSVASALRQLNKAFVEWRYLHERDRTPAVHFRQTIFAMHALHHAYSPKAA